MKDKRELIKYGLIICACLIPMFALGIASLIITPPERSDAENRMLKQKPELTAAAFFSGEYTRSLSEYYADTFPLRETFMTLSRNINGFYFFQGGARDGGMIIIERTDDDGGTGETILNVPHLSDDGASGGMSAERVPATAAPTPDPTPDPGPAGNDAPDTAGDTADTADTADVIEAPPTPAAFPDKSEAQQAGNVVVFGTRAMEIVYAKPAVMARYAETINSLAAAAPDTQSILMVAPNSGEFYSSVEMHTGMASQKNLISDVYAMLDDGVISVDAYGKLQSCTDEYIYFRTDHHWTALGAYYAYTAFCEAMGLEAVPLDDFETGIYEDFVGSMYNFTSKYPVSKILLDNPDTLTYYLPLSETVMTIYPDGPAMKKPMNFPVINRSLGTYRNKYICFIGGDNELTHIETSVTNGKSIIVVKESFANAFVPFLTSHYEHIWVIDPRKLNGSGQPAFNMADFTSKHGIGEVLYLNYPFMAVSGPYCGYLEKMR
ncbi:MAG: DHHW family protein [Oscillospiraceae bacterium]|nr:DHHW family protein [Oscillospiraceae bacterium]